ncbi:PD-(D/E)XK nuclease superfamily protein [Clostridium sp. C105KSO13]|nr:PD-(D/E)XK nuclease superfamily protein [Clostridium sp. C105KSO13]
MYNEDEYLQLSGIQHFAFCRRQWALAYIELQWSENVRTVEGKLLHEKAHDVSSAEKRGDLIISRAMPIYSRELGISGECDIVEFHKTEKGINLTGREGHFEVVPIEYKRGSPKQNDIDILQLTAQVLCLEEMLCCRIPYGYLFYGETRRRKKVEFDSSIRQKTKDVFQEMHQYYERRYTPRVRRTKACNACSLKDICLPALGINKSASAYISKVLSEEES